MHSLGGGTGSGLGSYIMEVLQVFQTTHVLRIFYRTLSNLYQDGYSHLKFAPRGQEKLKVRMSGPFYSELP